MDNGRLSINISLQYSSVVKEAIKTTHNACQSYSTLTAAVEPWASLCILNAGSRFDSTPLCVCVYILTPDRVALQRCAGLIVYVTVTYEDEEVSVGRRGGGQWREEREPTYSRLAKENCERDSVTMNLDVTRGLVAPPVGPW